MPAATCFAPAALDSLDYEPLDHLNAIFSHPSALPAVYDIADALTAYQDDLDESIAGYVAAQSSSDAASVRRMQEAKSELAELFKKVEGLRERATQTEQAITEMTADIKRLDNTKRNLTLSMTALKRLQMLTTAYDQLRGLSKTRQYRECAQLLQAVIQLMAHFKSYRSIDQIATLSRNVSDLQRELLEQVCEDFEISFAKNEVGQHRATLAESCLVMDALGEHAKQRLITWYCNTQLREYRSIFRGSDEAGSLDNIARRYSWCNRMLKTYDAEHAAIFPAHWRVGEMLANAFCEGTRDDFKAILQRSIQRADGQTLDVNLLLAALQETLNFEHSLERRFASESRQSQDTMTSRDDRPHGVGQIISEAFEPYMSLWVESQDKQLAQLIPKYRQQPLHNPDEEFSPQSVIPSSTELFHFYRLALAQCAKLSTGTRLLELSKTFGKYLDQYSQAVLFYSLTERNPSIEDTVLILNTADYCYATCTQLEEKIKARIDEDVRASIDLQSQADAFMGIASACVRSFVRRVEVALEPALREMRNMPWGRLDSVGDQSSYVTEMLRIIKESCTATLLLLHKPQYARAFCDHVVDAVVGLFLTSVMQCKPVVEVGAEQMLLDAYTLKKPLLELPTLTAPGTQPPAAFTKRATIALSKLDPLLKTLQVRPHPPEALVQAYLIHIGDRSEANFRKVLELKGVRRPEHAALVDLFNAHAAGSSYAHLPAANPVLAGLTLAPPQPKEATLAPQQRFDAGAFGSALINVAREGVDRFGSPVLGGAGQGKEVEAGTQLNENLKSIGKFFRRDTGFGRFGSKG
ncbi:hypothetical protein EJ06DRAFT_549039 [Trichodelitschia bisporula]|uniref:Uncharacterized protein n=1 Tax=Trichodelitschia bisporula TaxID=703511 RepID=A0A6G1HW86_9PEZI|nr:hypothetical protein EJ06DRAFT_549039 [Trichodelitschia bisporula]